MCPEMDLNHRPIDFQSIASTAELSGQYLDLGQVPLLYITQRHDRAPPGIYSVKLTL